ncbi:MAG: CBS domain-containing protein [Gammaproteobacteria bacterium]|nr:CBS domain-containing protein [Gammaproteobacteria bacterium]
MPTDLTLGFIEAHPRDAARLVAQMPIRQVSAFLREVPPAAISTLIMHMPANIGALSLQSLDHGVAAGVIEELDITTAALLLRRLKPRPRRIILSALQTVKAAPLRLVLDYPPGTVGSLMDPRAMTLQPDMSVEQALRQVRMSNHKNQHYFFVLGDEHDVLGFVSLHDLLFAPKQHHVGALMHPETEIIPARSQVESIRHEPQWRHMDVLPVVNQRQAYLGVIRFASVHVDAEDGHVPEGTGVDVLWGLVEASWSFVGSLLAAPERDDGDKSKDDG